MLLSKSGFHVTIIFFLLLSFHVGSAFLNVFKKCFPCFFPKTKEQLDEPQAGVNKPSIADSAVTLMGLLGFKDQLKMKQMKQIPVTSTTPADTDPKDPNEEEKVMLEKFKSIIIQEMEEEKDDNKKTQAEDKSTQAASQQSGNDLYKYPRDKTISIFDSCAELYKMTIAEHDTMNNFILPEKITRGAKCSLACVMNRAGVVDETAHALPEAISKHLSRISCLLLVMKPFKPEYKIIDSSSFTSALQEIANECAPKKFEKVRGRCEVAYQYALCVSGSPKFNEIKETISKVREERKRLEAEKAEKEAAKEAAKAAKKNK